MPESPRFGQQASLEAEERLLARGVNIKSYLNSTYMSIVYYISFYYMMMFCYIMLFLCYIICIITIYIKLL